MSNNLRGLIRQVLSENILVVPERNLQWFISKYSDEEAIYNAVSKYLYEGLWKERNISVGNRKELLEYIRQYTIDKTGFDPFLSAQTMTFNPPPQNKN